MTKGRVGLSPVSRRGACGGPPWSAGLLVVVLSVLAAVGRSSAAAAQPGGMSEPASGPLTGVSKVVGDDSGYCRLLSSSRVDCWGNGYLGELGNGTFYTSGHQGSAVPVQVKGVGGSGTLTGVSAVVSDGGGYCGLLKTGGVDCWGGGIIGDLGNGKFYTSGHQGSAVPVQVKGVGGSGTLTGVSALASGNGYCGLLKTGGVDCWGTGYFGELGNGTFYANENQGSAVPVQVKGVGGSGTLTGVKALVSDGGVGYCGLLSSGGVDCWGEGHDGELGNGTFYTTGHDGSAVPVQVRGVGGSGTLTGVSALISDGGGYCGVLGAGGVDCWGSGYFGQLGNGTFYTSGQQASAVPVRVKGVGGSGTLTGVRALVGDGSGYCGLLTSGGVDCWGSGQAGVLGNGTFYSGTDGSAVPVQVKGVGGSGTLTGISALISDGSGYCGVLGAGGVDCWGNGYLGELGNGTFYTSGQQGSAVPVRVKGVGGSGTLTGVTALAVEYAGYCGLLSSGGVDCWGSGYFGELGNGTFYTSGHQGSAVPVRVE